MIEIGGGGGHTIEILKVGDLDAFLHAQDVARGTQAVDQNPDVAGVQRAQRLGLFGAAVAILTDGGADIRPGGHDTRDHHETEGEQGHGTDGAAEPQHLAVGDQDDCQVLENGVDGDAEELEGLGRGVDHGDEQQRDGEPFPRLVDIEVAICYYFCGFAELNGDDADDVLTANQLLGPSRVGGQLGGGGGQTWMHNRKKFRLKLAPPSTYLFVTVMRMLAPQ